MISQISHLKNQYFSFLLDFTQQTNDWCKNLRKCFLSQEFRTEKEINKHLKHHNHIHDEENEEAYV